MRLRLGFPHLRVREKEILLTPAAELGFREQLEETPTGCWEWTGPRDPSGYGRAYVDYKIVGAHRVAFAIWKERPPNLDSGYQLDHLCRNRACCNPDHLEAVSNGENVARGYAAGSRARTHCKNGHKFTPENTYINNGTHGRTRRQCRTCILQRSADAYARKMGRCS